MKLVIVLLLTLSLSWASLNYSLILELFDFFRVIPMDKINEVQMDSYRYDPKYRAAINYLKSPEWVQLWNEFTVSPEYKNIQELLLSKGVNLELLLPSIETYLPSNPEEEKNFANYLIKVHPLINLAAIREEVNKKIESSYAFQQFYDMMTGSRMHNCLNKLFKSKTFYKVGKELYDMKMYVKDYIDTMYEFFGWKEFDFSNVSFDDNEAKD